MRKFLICFYLTLFLIISPCTPVFAAYLNIPAYQQEKSLWCWASCCQSIIEYCTSSSPSQTSIVTYIYGGPYNYGGGIDEKRQALGYWSVVNSYQSSSLTYNGIKSQISNNYPIIAVLQEWYGTGQYHDNIIRGYNDSYNGVLFIDPIDGDYHAQNYQDYRSGQHWNNKSYNWIRSIFDCDD